MTGPAVFGTNPYVQKTPVRGRIVAVLRGVTDKRGLHIADFRSRAVPRGVIHELMISDEPVDIGSTVNRVALIAFFEVTEGGVILLGDSVVIDGNTIGIVAGFDETHMPNHQNICLTGNLSDGESLDISLDAPVVFSRD
jgi:hypothetical protein